MAKTKIPGQSESIALLADFEGETIAGQTLCRLSYRIDRLISTKVSEERSRCFQAAHVAMTDALGKINGTSE